MKGRILIVDDDAHLRDSLRDNLELDGYEVSEAGSGPEALRSVVTGFYDVILMDYNLTDTTGIEVIRQIRKINTESQILMMTAHASLDTAILAIQESVYDFLIKPVDVNYLERSIHRALEKLRLQQENQRLINELKRANEQLLNLSNMKSKFMSMASHDMSNALMTMQLSFEMLASSLSPSDEQKKRMGYISNGIGQMTRLIDDLVDWAAIEQGRFRLDKAPVPLGKLIEEAVVGPQGKAAQRQVRLETRLPAGLPEVLADRRRITQVLSNLLENAIRHTPGGGAVTVSAERTPDGQARVAVEDTGDGIAPEDLPRLFESFFQSSGDKPGGARPRGRLGLGLSIAREIVTGHGGRIWVESPGAGKGSTFYFALPVGAEPGAPAPSPGAGREEH